MNAHLISDILKKNFLKKAETLKDVKRNF